MTDLSEDIPLLEAFIDAHQLDKDHGDDKKKEIIKKIAEAILSYHILPEYLTIEDLSKNSTFGTSLTLNDGSLDGSAQRIRVFTVPRILEATTDLFPCLAGRSSCSWQLQLCGREEKSNKE